MTTTDTDSLLKKAEERIAELESQIEAWKATAEQFKVSWGNEREDFQQRLDAMGSSQQICVGAAGIGDFDELCGWIDDVKARLAASEKARDEAKQLLRGTFAYRLKCDSCGDMFNGLYEAQHQGDKCPGWFYKNCKGTLQFNVPPSNEEELMEGITRLKALVGTKEGKL